MSSGLGTTSPRSLMPQMKSEVSVHESPCTFSVRGSSFSGTLDHSDSGGVSIVVQGRPTVAVEYWQSGRRVIVHGELSRFRKLGDGEYAVSVDSGDLQPWMGVRGHVDRISGTPSEGGPPSAA